MTAYKRHFAPVHYKNFAKDTETVVRGHLKQHLDVSGLETNLI